MKKCNLLCVLALVFFSALPAWATIFYVSTSGSNGNSCGTATSATAASAKLTIQEGVKCLASGDTLRIHAGLYQEAGFNTATTNIANGGGSYATATIIESYNGIAIWRFTGDAAFRFSSDDSYIIIRSAPGTQSTFVIDGQNSASNAFNIALLNSSVHHIKLEKLEMINANYSNIYSDLNTHDIWITGNYIHDNGQTAFDHGIYMEGDSSLIEYNRLESTTGTGTQLFSNFNTLSNGGSENNIFRYNYVANNIASGLVIDGDNNQVYHNVFRNNGTVSVFAAGIVCGYTPGSSGNVITNNTIHGNTAYGLQLGHTNFCTGLTVRNNSISSNTGACVQKEANSVSGTFDQNNCSGNGNNTIPAAITGTITNTSTDAPGYVNAGAFDFALTTGSLLINAGTTTAPAGLACNGTCDIGAHETITYVVGSAKLLDTASDNTIEMTFLNDRNPPALPVTGCAGFALFKGGVPDPLASCARTANNIITLTTVGGHISGDVMTMTYSPGNVSDGALIGNVYNQRLNVISTPEAIVNQVGAGGSVPVLTQVSYRFECFGGTEAAPDCTRALNTAIMIPPNASVRVRGLISNTVVAFGTAGFALFAQRNGTGGYVAIPNGPCPSTGICFAQGTGILPPELMVGATTEQLAGGGGFVAGGVQLNASEVPSVALSTGQDTELVAALSVGGGNSAGDYFDLRWYQAGVALTTYTQTPRLTIGGHTAQQGAR